VRSTKRRQDALTGNCSYFGPRFAYLAGAVRCSPAVPGQAGRKNGEAQKKYRNVLSLNLFFPASRAHIVAPAMTGPLPQYGQPPAGKAEGKSLEG